MCFYNNCLNDCITRSIQYIPGVFWSFSVDSMRKFTEFVRTILCMIYTNQISLLDLICSFFARLKYKKELSETQSHTKTNFYICGGYYRCKHVYMKTSLAFVCDKHDFFFGILMRLLKLPKHRLFPT